MTTNLKPADELLSVRQKIKALQERESELRDGMASGALPLSGDFSIAAFTSRKTSRFDRKAAEAELGSLDRFDVKGEATVLTVSELVRVTE